MSGKSRDGDDYGTFGTGVFDERDVWEDIYNDRGGTAGVMDSVALVAVEGTLGHGGSQDFVDAQGQEEPQLESRPMQLREHVCRVLSTSRLALMIFLETMVGCGSPDVVHW